MSPDKLCPATPHAPTRAHHSSYGLGWEMER